MEPPTRLRAKILVVDDEPVLRGQIRETLAALGHTIIEAGSGSEALRLAEAERPDLVLVDLMLPDVTGIEVCQRLRASPVTRDCRIIVVSGMQVRSALEESIIAGADDFLAKPIDAVELTVRVRSMLRVRNIHDDERRVEAYIQQIRSLRPPTAE